MLPEERNFVWLQDLRYPDYFRLENFENLIVEKVTDYREDLPPECWEATIFEDDSCQKVVGRQLFDTEKEAKEFLESYVVKKLKGIED
ncbi:MAG TPA: hypothetical protein VLG76_04840 [Rhabdochlamydiaceae bacterium]|nr:hypothetical protein [Rhabdochlamydiaceae bacterium]